MSVRDIIQAAAGAGGDKLYVEDVFSTYLYTGNQTSLTITNGIDLAGEGGMVWFHNRAGGSPVIFDTERGASAGYLTTNDTGVATTFNSALTSFNSDGFSLGANTVPNQANQNYLSWSMRKAPKFLDIVTYTGTGSNRTVAHNLGSVPGMIIVRRLDTGGTNVAEWAVYHRSILNTEYLSLNRNYAAFANATFWNSTTATDTQFSVGTNANVNASGGSYIAYIFAHDAGGFGEDGNQNIISCGTYTGNGSATGTVVNLGWEPQWLLIKRTVFSTDWCIIDTMRGFTVGGTDAEVNTNTISAETTGVFVSPTPTGFQLNTTSADYNASGQKYVYVAIRRGPMKTPESGAEVFSPIARAGTGANATITTNFVTDLVISSIRTAASGVGVFDRLRGLGLYLQANATAAQASDTTTLTGFDSNTGYRVGSDSSGLINLSGQNYVNWNFRRAPGFFDVVCYTGTGVARTVNHNLGVAPELMLVKRRNTTNAWAVYANNDNTDYLVLNTTAGTVDDNTYWNDTSPTSSVFSVGTNSAVNTSGSTYVAYLFASLPGISKVGSYTGTGTTQDINCGFTAGARFVLIKRVDSAGGWYIWDTARGIVSGNDPYITINSPLSNPQEVTNTDYIDPLASGFQISSTAPAEINASGGSYIYLAIA